MTYDYGEDTNERAVIGDNLMAQLVGLADRQEDLESRIESLREQLEEAEGELRDLANREIPALLHGVTGSLRLPDGRTIEIAEKWRASIAGKKAEPACQWLDENGYGELVKREFVVNFNRSEEEWARQFEKELMSRERPLAYKVRRTVHPQTLVAWVNEKMSEGVDLPKELLGMFHQKTTKVKRPE